MSAAYRLWVGVDDVSPELARDQDIPKRGIRCTGASFDVRAETIGVSLPMLNSFECFTMLPNDSATRLALRRALEAAEDFATPDAEYKEVE